MKHWSLRARLVWSQSYSQRASRCFGDLWQVRISNHFKHRHVPDSPEAIDLRDTAYTLADVAAMLAKPV